MALNLLKLASQGRAFDATRPYTAKELEGLLSLERDRGLDRRVAAEYIRNGILTVDAYDKALEAGVVPKSLEEIKEEAVVAHVAMIREKLGLKEDEDFKEEEKEEKKEEEKKEEGEKEEEKKEEEKKEEGEKEVTGKDKEKK